jgi:glycosyltransferase involved in cell wall biosynthesis
LSEERRPRISVCVLAYNEEANLPEQIREIREELEGLSITWELLIIDDGSTDGSGEVAERLAENQPYISVLHHEQNQGLGGGYRTGFASASGEWITFFPADCQFPASIIGQFLGQTDSADMILGYLKRRTNLAGLVLSATERTLYKLLFGGFPKYQGIVLFRRSLLDAFELQSKGRGWGIMMELILRTYRSPKHRVISLRTSIRPRLSGASKVQDLKSISSNARQLFALRMTLWS